MAAQPVQAAVAAILDTGPAVLAASAAVLGAGTAILGTSTADLVGLVVAVAARFWSK